MKNKSRLVAALGALTLMAGFAGVAQAVPMSWSDKYDPSDKYLDRGDSFTFTHSILADQGSAYAGTYGFNPATDTVTWAQITLRLYDAGNDGSEEVKFYWDGSSNSGWLEVDKPSIYEFGFSASGLTLLSDGLFTVKVQANNRCCGQDDFNFDWSFLEVRGTRSVPEPGTLALFGLALAGLGFAGRRRK